LLYVPAQDALGVPAIDAFEPDAVIVRQPGNVPLVNFQVYGGTPPETASCWEYAIPTAPGPNPAAVIAGLPATLIVALAVLLGSATEVAVTVTISAELEGAGAV
jgi:hypothetical protein